MAKWSAGYVTDVSYIPGVYREQSPELIQFAMLLSGLMPAGLESDSAAYCELGFGLGVGLAGLAAGHPKDQFWGIDFFPEQVSYARQFLVDACPNLQLFDDSFEEFADRETPQFDFITLHGIWSWISEENQRAIVRLLKRKLKVGGAVYVSYNAQPGWQLAAPLRDLLSQHAAVASASGAPSTAKVQEAMALVDRLAQNNAVAIAANRALVERFNSVKTMPLAYVAHEYLNEHWKPVYFSEVAAAMSDAKLSYAGSAKILRMIDSVNVSPAGLQHLQTIANPILREVLRDFYMNTMFRQDVFARGARRLNVVERERMLDEVRLVLVADPSALTYKVTTALGESTMQEDIYRPLVESLERAGSQGMTIAQLSEHVALRSRPKASAWEAAMLLVATDAACPIVDPRPNDARQSAAALNRRFAQLNHQGQALDFRVSPVTFGPGALDRVQGLMIEAHERGIREPAEMAKDVWTVLKRLGQRVVKDGKALESEEDNLAQLRAVAKEFLKSGLRRYQRLGFA